MPLITMCGQPCAGKTWRAHQLQQFLERAMEEGDVKRMPVHMVNEETLGIDRRDAYSGVEAEKQTRSQVRSAVERLLSQDSIVIVDYLNAQKGFRYELFTRAREVRTPHMVIFVATPLETCSKFHAHTLRHGYTSESESESHNTADDNEDYTEGEHNAYPVHIFDDLMRRLEVPEPRRRWDRPCFTLLPETSLDSLSDELVAAVRGDGKRQKTSFSTAKVRTKTSNVLQRVDVVAKKAETLIREAQRDLAPHVVLPGVTEKIMLRRQLSPAELRRIKRGFEKLMQLRPPHGDDLDALIAKHYVAYINAHLEKQVDE